MTTFDIPRNNLSPILRALVDAVTNHISASEELIRWMVTNGSTRVVNSRTERDVNFSFTIAVDGKTESMIKATTSDYERRFVTSVSQIFSDVEYVQHASQQAFGTPMPVHTALDVVRLARRDANRRWCRTCDSQLIKVCGPCSRKKENEGG